MKKVIILLLVFIIFTLTFFSVKNCDVVFNGHRCIVYESTYAENDDYIVFPVVVYNKKTDKYYQAKTLDDKYYNGEGAFKIELIEDKYNIYTNTKKLTFSYDGKMISEEVILDEKSDEYKYSLIEEGFYSSHQRINPDEEKLTDMEKEIWEYAKTKSLKKKFPYYIEGNCKRKDHYIYFNVNVYDKAMWKGQSLVNQGARSATLNRINENTKEIEELLSFNNSSIKCFNDDYVFLYNKKKDSLDYYNIKTKEQKTISKSDDWYFFYITEKYALRIYQKSASYSYKLYTLN